MILGVNTSHNASFCCVDGEGMVRWLLEEERYCRLKNAPFATLDALDYATSHGMIDPHLVDTIVYSFEMDEEVTCRLADAVTRNVQRAFGADIAAKIFARRPWHSAIHLHGELGSRRNFGDTRRILEAKFPKAAVASLPHHLCHAASAYYPFNVQQAAVLIVDGAGRLETTTIWRGDNCCLTELARSELPHSLGLLYWLVSGCLLGMEEGQTMGLASYGRPLLLDRMLEQLVDLEESGFFRLRAPGTTWFDLDSTLAIDTLESILGIKQRVKDQPLQQQHADLAASIQHLTEMVISRLAIHSLELARSDVICLAGGVIQNCAANGEVAKLAQVAEVHIQPAAHDAGTALGAALETWVRREQRSSSWRMVHAMQGGDLDVDVDAFRRWCGNLGLQVGVVNNADETVAQQLSDGRTVARACGRAEVGPRALGHRSIFAHPGLPFMAHAVNRIKQRQVWRPLAPACLEEEEGRFFESRHSSPFMLIRQNAGPLAAAKLPAVVHIDGSARVQSVRQCDVRMRDLLLHFQRQTGLPIVLNTSLNRRGEPLVQRPLEALVAALNGKVDSLFVDNLHVRMDSDATLDLPSCARFLGLLFERLENREVFLATDRLAGQRPDCLATALHKFGHPFTRLAEGEGVVWREDAITILFEPWEHFQDFEMLGALHPQASVIIQESSGYVFECLATHALKELSSTKRMLSRRSVQTDLLFLAGPSRNNDLIEILSLAAGRVLRPVTLAEVRRKRAGDIRGALLLTDASALEDPCVPAELLQCGFKYGEDWLAVMN